ncbi:hypothetical protein E1N52_33350 [Paraburkholderia guartelaensis]|uniref:Uncharacterized protein n=1 Tax=Paraburkholderia guartelaensis TaxID=2546446 RepID=A0A4R5L4S4_9BURK|nr:hypothetical protein [Paraburkholderia guartelaensis]TDG03670.1 hypothetical protein E1N52_33350 [Paraburkholderia guartelaensis]
MVKKAVFWLDGEQLQARDGAGGRAYCVPRRTMRGASRGESRAQTQRRSARITNATLSNIQLRPEDQRGV